MTKKKNKTKIIYRTPKNLKVTDKEQLKEVKEEIADLENQRNAVGTGWKGFLRKAAINKQINEKRGFLTARDRLRMVEQQNKLGRALVEKEKIKADLQTYKKKTQVNFGDLYKGM